MAAYWQEREFRPVWDRVRTHGREADIEQMIEMFRKLADGYWRRYSWRFYRLDRDEAIAAAVAICWRYHERVNFEKGTAFNYFTKLIQHEITRMSENETVHQHRYTPASMFDAGEEFRD